MGSDCLLVNEVGLKQYLRAAQVLLPTVMMLPSGSLQVFSLSQFSDASGKNLHEALCEVTARELLTNLVASGG